MGHFHFAGLIFADDIVCVSKSAKQLNMILNKLRIECEKICMQFSVDKTQIVSPSDDMWEVWNGDGSYCYSL